jgi:hypothetical protein
MLDRHACDTSVNHFREKADHTSRQSQEKLTVTNPTIP